MPPSPQIPLPPAVEHLISTICLQKSQPQPDNVARRYLSELTDQDQLEILHKIRKSTTVRTLSGFIVHLVKEKKKENENDRKRKRDGSVSPQPPPVTPDTSASLSPNCRTSASPGSVTSTPYGNASSLKKPRRALNFSDEVVTSIVEHFVGSPSGSDAYSPMQYYDGSDMQMEYLDGSITTSEAVADVRITDSLADAFAKLEFRQAFLMLNYLGRCKLEDEVSTEFVGYCIGLDMRRFEFEIWNAFGRRLCRENERRKCLEWESGNSYSYHCHVSPDGSYIFKGPILSKTTTVLQKAIGDENVLIVKFSEEEVGSLDPLSKSKSKSLMTCPAFNKVFEEGIYVGQRRYQFFVYKDGGKEEKKKSPTSSAVKCYFVNLEAFASFVDEEALFFPNKSIQDARSVFMHIRQASSLANYMARLSLILSKTITLNVNFDQVRVEEIEDVPCLDKYGQPVFDDNGKLQILTDGTGFISEDLALKCPQNCFKGFVPDVKIIKSVINEAPHLGELPEFNHLKSRDSEPPLLIQFRMFHKGQAVKGTVLLNKKLPPNTIQVRPSMIKVRPDDKLDGAPSLNRFEIVGTSNKPKEEPRLSKNLIALLHDGGVPSEYFLGKLSHALEDAKFILSKTRAALKVAVNRDVDEDFTIARMILSGIPLDEPFLQHRLSVFAKEERKNLKAGKIPIEDCFYVMGTADPTGTLKSGQVCVILEHGQISGKVLVYRNPGIHSGDIHEVNATYVKELEDMVGNSKYGIFFPSEGSRSMADEIAGGDYDGDMYWVCKNPELLKHFKQRSPWKSPPSLPSSPQEKPSNLSDEVLELKLFRLFVSTRCNPSNAMGMAADWWLVYMDRLLTPDVSLDEKESLKLKIFKLIDTYYDALDAPKKGKTVIVPEHLEPEYYPHHMERGGKTYTSKSILGKIYDKVEEFNNLDPINVWRLPYFNEQIRQIPEDCLEAWRLRYNEYRGEMIAALNTGLESKTESATAVYRTYKRMLFGIGPDDEADKLGKSRKAWEDIRLEALAVYNAAYEHASQADDPQKCNFAWKVAGSALFKIFMEGQDEKPIMCAPSVLREVFR